MASFFPNLFGGRQQQALQGGQQQPQAPQGQQANPMAGSPVQPFSGLNFQQQPQGGQQQQQQQQQPNPQDPAFNQNQNQQQTPVSPLDGFTSLWNNPNKDGAQQPQDPWSQPLLGADSGKIMENAAKHDFMRSVPQELLQKATSGDMGALIQVINHVGQQSLGIGAQLAAASVEHGGRQIRDRFDSSLEGRFRQFSDKIQTPTNPVLSHPAVQPMVEMLRNQARTNNPQWTPQQVNSFVENYFAQFSQAFAPQQQSQQQNDPAQEKDWTQWVGLNG